MTAANVTRSPSTSPFQYDQVNDKLFPLMLKNVEYTGWSTKLSTANKTMDAADLNAFQITVKQGDIGLRLVYLTDMVLDGPRWAASMEADGRTRIGW